MCKRERGKKKKKKNQGRRKKKTTCKRERERESMILKTGPRTKSNLPPVLNFLSFIWFFPVLGLFSRPN